MVEYIWDDDIQNTKFVSGTERYRSKWACFDCRKSFTRTRGSSDPDEVKCPDCQKKSIDMGYLFKAPPKRDIRRWKIMEILGRNHIRFNTAGNVAYINYMLTGNNKLSPKDVEQNVYEFLKR